MSPALSQNIFVSTFLLFTPYLSTFPLIHSFIHSFFSVLTRLCRLSEVASETEPSGKNPLYPHFNWFPTIHTDCSPPLYTLPPPHTIFVSISYTSSIPFPVFVFLPIPHAPPTFPHNSFLSIPLLLSLYSSLQFLIFSSCFISHKVLSLLGLLSAPISPSSPFP